MITRRKFVAGGLVAGCSCGFHSPLFASEEVIRRTNGSIEGIKSSAGCFVSTGDFNRSNLGLLGSGQISSFKAGGDSYRVSATSGNRLFDRAMAEALFQMSQLFDVLPTFGFIKGGNVVNAFATTALYKREEGDADLPEREDGTVLFGDGIVSYLQRKGVEDPVAAVLAVCAHEFGHIVQYRYSFQEKPVISLLNDGQPTVKRAELHADLLAGFYVGSAAKRNPNTPAADVALAASVLGDFDTDQKGHHGTPKERGAAVREGFKLAFEKNDTFGEALVKGLDYVGAI